MFIVLRSHCSELHREKLTQVCIHANIYIYMDIHVYIYIHTHLHLYFSLHDCILKAVSSHQYIPFQLHTTEFILNFSFSILETSILFLFRSFSKMRNFHYVEYGDLFDQPCMHSINLTTIPSLRSPTYLFLTPGMLLEESVCSQLGL